MIDKKRKRDLPTCRNETRENDVNNSKGREVGGKRKRKRERAVINVMSIMIRSTTTQPSKVSASVLAVSRVPQESKKKQERDKTD